MSKTPPNVYEKNVQTVYSHNQKELLDPATGEVVLVDNIVKTSTDTKSFWKCYLMDFLGVLGIIDNKQLDVFIYIAENTNASNNLFIGTYRKIAEKTGTSTSTVTRIMKKLQANNFVSKIQNGVWFVNPNILMRGSDTKRQILLSYYLDTKKSTTIERIPNAKPLKAEAEITPNNLALSESQEDDEIEAEVTEVEEVEVQTDIFEAIEKNKTSVCPDCGSEIYIKPGKYKCCVNSKYCHENKNETCKYFERITEGEA